MKLLTDTLTALGVVVAVTGSLGMLMLLTAQLIVEKDRR